MWEERRLMLWEAWEIISQRDAGSLPSSTAFKASLSLHKVVLFFLKTKYTPSARNDVNLAYNKDSV